MITTITAAILTATVILVLWFAIYKWMCMMIELVKNEAQPKPITSAALLDELKDLVDEYDSTNPRYESDGKRIDAIIAELRVKGE